MTVEATLGRMDPPERFEYLQAEVSKNLRNDPSHALDLAMLLLATAEELDDQSSVPSALIDMGVAHYYLGEYQEALRRYERALELATSGGEETLMLRALNNIGTLYFVWGEHDLALEYYLQVLPIQLETGDEEGAARSYNNIAAVHQSAGRFPSALEHYALALDLYRRIGNRETEAGTLNNMGLALIEQEMFQSAVDHFEQALVIERAQGDRHGEALSLNNMGLVQARRGQAAEAAESYAAALAIRREIEDRRGESVSLRGLGAARVDAGDFAGGISLMEEALAIARELEVQELIRDDLLALAEAWQSVGRNDLAIDYFWEYKKAHDVLFDEERARQVAMVEARFEVDLKDREIQSLKREAEFELFRRNIMFVGAVASFLIMILLWSRYRFQKKAHRSISEKNEALHLAHAELEEAAREELAHVSRVATMGELTAAFAHELRQPLAAIKISVRTLRNLRGQPASKTDETDETDTILSYIREDAERAREIIDRLREMMRKGKVHREVCNVNDVIRSGIRFIDPATRLQAIPLRENLAPQLPSIECDPIQLQQVLINLVQNALVAMEGQEGEILISTSNSAADMVLVQIQDSGPPVPAETLANFFDPFFTTKDDGLGMGLPICRTIIEAHGGTMRAVPNPEGGMTMEFELPSLV